MPKSLLFCLIGLTLLCGSCCMTTCDCFDEGDDAISFRFVTDSTGADGYTREELMNTCLLRIPQTGSPVDTIHRIGEYDLENFGTQYVGFTIWNNPSKEHYISPYTYRIVNDSSNIHLEVTDIVTRGKLSGNSCCSCYTNESVVFKLNGVEKSFQGGNRSGAFCEVRK